jgi:16S rRNA (cytosine1402-N4)-methyltransferase
LTAARILAEYDEAALRRIFWEYGDEKLAPRYARRIVEERRAAPIETSARLVAIIDAATPAAARRAGHQSKRVFQALRIEVNQELAVLERAIPAAIDALEVGGRIVVMSYQSLEDRSVKREFQARSTSTAPRGLPVELPEHRPELRILTRGAELADDAERARNPRATPVRLRAAERIREAA